MKRLLLLLGLLLGVSGVLAGDTVTESFSFTPASSPFLELSGSIPAFNSSLGKLESIHISLSAVVVGTVSIANQAGKAGTFDFSVASPLELFDPILSSLFTVRPTFAGSLVIPIGGLGTSVVLVSPPVSDAVTLTSGFDPYEGSGTYTFLLFGGVPEVSVTGPWSDRIGPGAFLAAGSSSVSSAGGTVSYTFLPAVVSEPSSFMLLLGGLLVLGYLVVVAVTLDVVPMK
jgi:hypothetical protein